ncbi:MAG: hypothetical protein U0842_25325 [Candidatus Binatia bacterium]
MARPKKADPWVTVSLRLPRALIEEIDRHSERLREETPLLEISRADTMRYLLKVALQEAQKKGGRKAK